MFEKRLILIDQRQDSDLSIIKVGAKYLKMIGYVDGDFEESILEREKNYPTGLSFEEYGVAMPHCDPRFVNESAVLICKPSDPISFKEMGGSGKTVKCNIVFMIAVKSGEEHMLLLQKLMSLFKNEELMKRIITSDNTDDIYSLIKKGGLVE